MHLSKAQLDSIATVCARKFFWYAIFLQDCHFLTVTRLLYSSILEILAAPCLYFFFKFYLLKATKKHRHFYKRFLQHVALFSSKHAAQNSKSPQSRINLLQGH